MLGKRAAAVAACLALLGSAGDAEAAGLWLTTGDVSPRDMRLAVAQGPAGTTVWVNVAFGSWPTTLALVLPVPSGTMVDVASDAWLEALEVATAPPGYDLPGALWPGGSSP